MGPEWVTQHLDPGGKYSDWLVYDVKTQADATLRVYRLVHVAEVLYSLQDQPEFAERVKRMKSENVADIFNELDVTWWLRRKGAAVTLRSDDCDGPRYDADIVLEPTFPVAPRSGVGENTSRSTPNALARH
jgi:hypothetical protein